MADKICGDGIGNSTARLYSSDVDLITPSTMYGSSPGEPRTLVQTTDPAGPKKKPTSFQITSVTVQGSRLSNDGGDESADDLDESHTEDLSSDILDCSKTTDVENDQLSPTAENATTIATAVEPPAGAPNTSEPVGVSTSSLTSVTIPPAVVTTGGSLTIVTSASNPSSNTAHEVPINPDHWQRRFKVVKIVSSEPFGRGRWLCMDFVDPPAMQGDSKLSEENRETRHDLPPAVSNEAVAHVYEIPMGQTYPTNNQQGPLYGIILPVSPKAQGAPLSVLQPVPEQAKGQLSSVAHHAADGVGMSGVAPVNVPASVPPPVVCSTPVSAAVSASGPVPAVTATGQLTVPASEHAMEAVPENANKSATEEDSERYTGPSGCDGRFPLRGRTHKSKVHDFFLTSAGSTVAIDNKIEQAMDLVKSHLMFAVREEVDVLKEKITELLDRISQLEYENGILRAHATPETLSRLSQPPQQPQQQLPQQAVQQQQQQPT
ncbi:TSC22 domain family protein 2-like isoform X1 [Ornithodoros turicata]|uniref:TSC22 domain family protein 2-like isoform X1 n=1 Tax=Ornithodoros turicata TaxID=34597 RepID=UPI0031399B86